MTTSFSLLALFALFLAGCTDVRATTTRAAPASTPIASATPQAGSPAPRLETDEGLAAASRLEQAAYLHRIGNYTEEQRLLLALLTGSEAAGARQQERSAILYRLALAYLADEQPEPALDALEQLLLQTGSLPQEDPRRANSVFLRAEALAGLGRSEEAVAAYGTFLAQRPQVTGPVEEIVADVWLAAGELPRAANALRRAAHEAVSNSEKARLLERLATTSESDERWNDAAVAYDELLSISVWPSYRANILYRAGAAYAAADREETAISRWRQALDEAPASNAASQSLMQLVNREIHVALLLQGEINLSAAAYLPAIDAFERFLEESRPYDDRAGQAWLGLGRAHLGLEQWDEALHALNRVLVWYPTCDCFGDAWLARARLEIARDAPGVGRRIYRTFAREHPDDPLAPEALWRSALASLDADSQSAAEGMADPLDEAVADLLTLADSFPHSERAPDGLLKLGIEAFARGRYPQAASLLDRLLADYPDVHPDAARYWLGRARHTQGETGAARSLWQALVARDPETFYGVLAGLALSGHDEPGRDLFHRRRMGPVAAAAAPLPDDDDGSRAFVESWLSEWVWLPPGRGNQYDAPNREAGALSGSWPASGSLEKLPQTVANDPDLTGGALLLALGRRAEGLKLLEQVYRRYRGDSAALYPLMLRFDDLGANQLSIRAAWYLIQRSPARRTADAPLFLQRVAYPRHFPRLVELEAADFDIDPLLFYSLIFQESLFEPAARSYAGARGLTQVIPSTGAEIAERLAYPDYHTGLLNRPFVNIRFGTFYLRWVRDYVGDNTAALAGYNAGPGNARYWLERLDRTPPDDALFIEFIPYTETRRYLRRILTHYAHYLRIYGES